MRIFNRKFKSLDKIKNMEGVDIQTQNFNPDNVGDPSKEKSEIRKAAATVIIVLSAIIAAVACYYFLIINRKGTVTHTNINKMAGPTTPPRVSGPTAPPPAPANGLNSIN